MQAQQQHQEITKIVDVTLKKTKALTQSCTWGVGVPAVHPAGTEWAAGVQRMCGGWDQERIAVGDHVKISKAISSAV